MSTRRTFLKTSAATLSVPYFWTSQYVAAQDENSRPTVAAIGVGGKRGRYSRGGSIANGAARFGRMITCCDVDGLHNDQFNERFGGKLNTYIDYRKMFDKEKPDVVTIGTPDHWHVPIATHALRSGCDVYCEKPLTLTIQEGIDICKVVKETGKVFQVGTQQRSEMGSRFLKAIAIVKSGALGEKVNAFVAIGGAPKDGPFKSTEAPSELDWNIWVGPAPKVDYCEERRKMFRWWFEYSGGKMTDWGAHHIDIAQWALGFDNSGPVKATAKGQFPPIIPDNFNWDAFLDGKQTLPNGFNTAANFTIDLEFGNGSIISVNDHYRRESDNISFGNGILFEGEKGRIFVNRGKLQGQIVDSMTKSEKEELDKKVIEVYRGKEVKGHMANFFECLESRDLPISDVYTHHRIMTSCHLCNISLMLGRSVNWNPEKEEFTGDDQANALMSRVSRDEFASA